MSKFTDTMKGLFSGTTTFTKIVAVVAIIAFAVVALGIIFGG